MPSPHITGAGSTWVLSADFQVGEPLSQKKTGNEINYASIGSGGGIKQIEGGTVAFGASDMPLKPEDLAKAKLIQFPTAIAGEDLVYNLPGIGARLFCRALSLRISIWAKSRSGTIRRSRSSTPA